MFLHTRNIQLGNEIKKQYQWIKHQNIEYTRIHLAKNVKDQYKEHYKTLQREVREWSYVCELDNTIILSYFLQLIFTVQNFN